MISHSIGRQSWKSLRYILLSSSSSGRKRTGKFNMIKHGMDMLKLYRHMKGEEERYGMKVKMSDMLKVSEI